ncbi:MAG: RusA family crossover junction endodeoxyribonuclease [Kiritimatiellae bacterium]|nr:RusA family crossover junction endodeoxyribonuclease [Kiritimatiellia bacterium]
MVAVEFDLPWPPSVNNYYRHVGPRVLISRAGRKYRMMAVSRLAGFTKLAGRLSLYAELYPPDRRRRDIDNVGGKCLLDSLQAAGLFDDDSQIKELHLKMLDPIEDGLVHVVLKEMRDG